MIRSADRLLHTDEGAREQYRQALAYRYQVIISKSFP